MGSRGGSRVGELEAGEVTVPPSLLRLQRARDEELSRLKLYEDNDGISGRLKFSNAFHQHHHHSNDAKSDSLLSLMHSTNAVHHRESKELTCRLEAVEKENVFLAGKVVEYGKELRHLRSTIDRSSKEGCRLASLLDIAVVERDGAKKEAFEFSEKLRKLESKISSGAGVNIMDRYKKSVNRGNTLKQRISELEMKIKTLSGELEQSKECVEAYREALDLKVDEICQGWNQAMNRELGSTVSVDDQSRLGGLLYDLGKLKRENVRFALQIQEQRSILLEKDRQIECLKALEDKYKFSRDESLNLVMAAEKKLFEQKHREDELRQRCEYLESEKIVMADYIQSLGSVSSIDISAYRDKEVALNDIIGNVKLDLENCKSQLQLANQEWENKYNILKMEQKNSATSQLSVIRERELIDEIRSLNTELDCLSEINVSLKCSLDEALHAVESQRADAPLRVTKTTRESELENQINALTSSQGVMKMTLLEQVSVLRHQIEQLTESNLVAEETNDTLLEENRRLRHMIDANHDFQSNNKDELSTSVDFPSTPYSLNDHSTNVHAPKLPFQSRPPTLLELAAASPTELFESPPQ